MPVPVRRILRWTTILAVLAGIGWMVWGMARGPVVQVVPVQRRDLEQRVVTSGRLLPEARVSVGAVVVGRVAEVAVREGARVQKGQLLIALSDTEAKAQVDERKAAVAQTEARAEQIRKTSRSLANEGARQASLDLAQARRRLDRVQRLFEAQAGAKTDLDAAADAVELAQGRKRTAELQVQGVGEDAPDLRLTLAAVDQSRALLAAAEARLAETRILAPAAGTVLSRAVEQGDVVQPGRALMVLAADGERLILTQPEERQLGVLKVGQQGLASADAFPDRRMPVQVVSIAPSVDPLRGTIEVKLKIDRPDPELRADMTLSVDVEVGRRSGVLVVPVEMLRDASSAEPWVLVVADGMALKRKLVLGPRGEGVVEIRSGLREGELLLVPGAKRMQPGTRVRAKGQD
jgi:HlyD family secretion protein